MRRLLVVVIVMVAFACGKRGDPRPPVPVIPQATSDLVVTQRAAKVILSWSYPSLTTAGKSLTGIRRISVFRYVEELPVTTVGRDPKSILPGDIDPTLPQPVALFSKIPTIPAAQFARLSTRLDSIESANLPAATAGSRLAYTDTPPIQAADGRPVRVTYAVVTEAESARSDFSNMATIIPLPVAAPPGPVTATARAEGIVVSWTAPQTSVSGGGAPVIAGYNIHRSPGGQVLDELPPPINPSPVTATTYTDTPPYGEHDYRITAVALVGPPAIASDPSHPARATFKDLVAPPVPKNLDALLETKLVRLIWDPVDAPDLQGYHVYRFEGPHRLKLTTGPTKDPFFSDISIDIGIAYRYEVTAIDKSGNESAPAKTREVIVPKTP